MTLTEQRWNDIKDRPLLRGSHSPDGQMCVMEMSAYLAGEPWTDAPECVSPAIAAFLRTWNDQLDDETRQRLKPYALKVIGTATGPADEQRRAWLVTDWLVRTLAPAWLDLAKLPEEAAALRALPELSSRELASAALPTINSARKRSAAARDAAGAAAWAAARDAARDAAGAAAWAAARDAAWAAAWAEARDAARDAAWDAAWAAAGAAAGAAARAAARDALAPTVATLQESAFGLLDSMIAVGKPA